MPSRTLAGAVATLAALGAAAGIAIATGQTDTTTAPARAQLTDPPRGDAARLLATLPVRTAPDPGDYDRDAFGSGWTDPDRNGCDTRADVLAADATQLRPGPDCPVAVAIVDPYTGDTITPRQAQIDHVVPLADAWRSGAATWSPQRRAIFAEDTANLIAVSAGANRAKSDSTADQWLPPAPAARCPYVAHQIAVKAIYHLSVSVAEQRAMTDVLAGCPGQNVPSEPR